MTDNQRQHAENKGREVIRIGRKRIRAASMIASIAFSLLSASSQRQIRQSGWRFGGKPDGGQQTNLEVDVIT